MESFSNPIFEGIDSPMKLSTDLQVQKAFESQLQSQLQQDLLKFEGLEKDMVNSSYSYEELKIEVLELKNSLLSFQSKFERQKATNTGNFNTIELLKQELLKKSTANERISKENLKAKEQINELLLKKEAIFMNSSEKNENSLRLSSEKM